MVKKEFAAVIEAKKRLQQKAVFKGNLASAERDALAKSFLKSR